MADVPDFRSTTVEALAASVRSGERSARSLTDAALDRIEAGNVELNAFVAIDAEAAQRQADAIDERLAAGEDVGPLAGIPIGVKDLEDAAGFARPAGPSTSRIRPFWIEMPPRSPACAPQAVS